MKKVVHKLRLPLSPVKFQKEKYWLLTLNRNSNAKVKLSPFYKIRTKDYHQVPR